MSHDKNFDPIKYNQIPINKFDGDDEGDDQEYDQLKSIEDCAGEEQPELVIDLNTNEDDDDEDDDNDDDEDLEQEDEDQEEIVTSSIYANFSNNSSLIKQQSDTPFQAVEQQLNCLFKEEENAKKVDSNNNDLISSSSIVHQPEVISDSLTTSINNRNNVQQSQQQHEENGNRKENSIYRGLYPINDVKKFFRKTIQNGQKLYTCLWEGCDYKTLKYSQHISRHIYLKHIGIKKLVCDVPGCNKMFKRPESLVQHRKNHSCGFGIDAQIMKDPQNLCGVANIRRFYVKTLDVDMYVFQCKYGDCEFHTHNSGSIRRHVHNQHVCPHSTASSNTTNNQQQQRNASKQAIIMNQNLASAASLMTFSNESFNQSKNLLNINHGSNDSSSSYLSSSSGQMMFNDENLNLANVEVQLNEFDGQMYDPEAKKIRNIQDGSEENVETITPIFSQKHQENEDEDDHTIDGDDDDNDSINGRQSLLENVQKSSSKIPIGIKDVDDDDDLDLEDSYQNQTPNQGQSVNLLGDNNVNGDRNVNGLYSLKNFKGRYHKNKKTITENGTTKTLKEFQCNQCPFTCSSQITLVRHLWSESNHKDFPCEICSQRFENEFSLYRHRKNEHRTSSPTPPSRVASPQQPPPVSTQSISSPQLINNDNNENNNSNEMISPAHQQLFIQNLQNLLSSSGILDLLMLQQPPNFVLNEVERQNQFQNLLQNSLASMAAHQHSNGEPINQNILQRLIHGDGVPLMPPQQVLKEQQQNPVQSIYEQIKEQDGSITFRCKLCPDYSVRTKASIKKHIRNFHSPSLSSNTNFETSTGNVDHSSETVNCREEHHPDDNHPDNNFRASSPLCQDNETNDDEGISSVIDSSMSKQTPLSGRKYKGREKTGLYSLKKFHTYYRRLKSPHSTGYQYECTQCSGEQQYATTSQASMIRHIWQHKPQTFDCTICNIQCENEFALYKHKKQHHPEMTSQHSRTKSSSSTNSSKDNKTNNFKLRSINCDATFDSSQMVKVQNDQMTSVSYNFADNTSQEQSSIAMQQPNFGNKGQQIVNLLPSIQAYEPESDQDYNQVSKPEEQSSPIPLVTREESNDSDSDKQSIDSNECQNVPNRKRSLSSSSPMKTSRRNMCFKKYKYDEESNSSTNPKSPNYEDSASDAPDDDGNLQSENNNPKL